MLRHLLGWLASLRTTRPAARGILAANAEVDRYLTDHPTLFGRPRPQHISERWLVEHVER